MDPSRYCQQAIKELRRADSEQGVPGQQKIVVLAYFAELHPSEQDFSSQLKLLAESAGRSGRTSLAQAARSVLDDWQSRAATANTSS